VDLWQKYYREPDPAGIRKEVLIPFLSYRIQEIAYGGLNPSASAELRRIARSLKKDPGSSELPPRPELRQEHACSATAAE
jgi:hypothetical protein